MKMTPESTVIDNPMLAERVRNVRYEPMKYNNDDESDEKYERKTSKPSSKTKSDDKKREETKT
jgi:hypothetical protein